MKTNPHFLIVHLVSNGDCLMSTAFAHHLKTIHPHCTITWAISYKCKQVIGHNNDVDHIWEITYDAEKDSPYQTIWSKVKQEALALKKKGTFQEVFFLQIPPDNHHYFDGTTRSTLFNQLKDKPSDLTPRIHLTDIEVQNVSDFALKHDFKSYQKVVLIECAPSSGQSFINLELMLELLERLAPVLNNHLFIVSSHLKINTAYKNIIDASALTYRENAELSKYCSHFIGCSSGISWLLTSNWAKELKQLQLLKKNAPAHGFASLVYDFKHHGIDHQHIIECDDKSNSELLEIIECFLSDFEKAKQKYHQTLVPYTHSYLKEVLYYKGTESFKNYLKHLGSVRLYRKRNARSLFFEYQYKVLLSIAFLKETLKRRLRH